jgi:hypothetical protein
MDFDRLVLLVTLASVFAMAARVPVDHDGWWHLATGRTIVERGSIPHTDPFSHTRAGAPWIDNGWLAQIVLYLAYRWLGYAGLGLLVALAAVVTTAILWPQMDGGPLTRAFILILAGTASGPVWTVRPHLATYVLTAGLGLLVLHWRSGRPRALWAIPPLFVLWVNLHAGYILGLGLLALVAFGAILDRLRDAEDARPWRDIASLTATGGITLALVPLNPYGVALWRYPFHNAGQAFAHRYIAEWASPDFHHLINQPFAAMLLLMFLAVGLCSRRGRWTELLPVAAFAYLTLRSQRAMGLFALVTAPVLSRYAASCLAGLTHRPRQSHRARPIAPGQAALNGGLALLVIAAAALKAGMVWRRPAVEAAVRELGYPVDATAWIIEHDPPGQLYNPYRWGGYLIWHLFPEYRVFVDGRADMYGDPFLLVYTDLASAAPGWEDVFASYGVCTALVEGGDPLSNALAQSPDWERVHGDETAAIYVRTSNRCKPRESLVFGLQEASRPSALGPELTRPPTESDPTRRKLSPYRRLAGWAQVRPS